MIFPGYQFLRIEGKGILWIPDIIYAYKFYTRILYDFKYLNSLFLNLYSQKLQRISFQQIKKLSIIPPHN